MYEQRAKCKGKVLIDNDEYNQMRSKLINLICEMNKVASLLTFRLLILKEKAGMI